VILSLQTAQRGDSARQTPNQRSVDPQVLFAVWEHAGWEQKILAS
jgi:hypothetical protein